MNSDTQPTTTYPQSRTRLSLDAAMGHHGALDGGWWPRSRDATAELADLAAALLGPLAGISRLTVDAGDWDNLPRRSITVGGHMVRVGTFPHLNHTIIVTRGRQDTTILLVIPPDTDPGAAAMALKRAAAGTGSAPAQQILTDCEILTARPPSAGVDLPSSPLPLADEAAEISQWLDDGAPVQDRLKRSMRVNEPADPWWSASRVVGTWPERR